MPPLSGPSSERKSRTIKVKARKSKESVTDDEDYVPGIAPRKSANTRASTKSSKQPKAAQQGSSPSTGNDDNSNSNPKPSRTRSQRKAKPMALKEDYSSGDESPTVTPTKRRAKSDPSEEVPPSKKSRKERGIHQTQTTSEKPITQRKLPAKSTSNLFNYHLNMLKNEYERKESDMQLEQIQSSDLRAQLQDFEQKLATAREESSSLKTQLEESKKKMGDSRVTLVKIKSQLERARNNPSSNPSTQNEDKELAADLALENRELREKNDILKEDFADLSSHAVGLEERMNKDPDFSNDNVTDDEINRKWMMLGNLIRQLTVQVLCAAPTSNAVPPNAQHPEDVALLLEDYTKAPGVANYYIIRFIWDQLVKDIFNGGGCIWGGAVGSKYLEFVRTLHSNEFGLEEAEAFSFVKGRASDLLDSIFRKYKDNWDGDLNIMVGELAEDLAMFVEPTMAKDFNWRMKEILDKALELQRIFARSRAFFVVKMVADDAELDEQKMDIKLWMCGCVDDNVKLAFPFSPMVTKIGNADGWRFEGSGVVCKAWVSVAPIEEE